MTILSKYITRYNNVHATGELAARDNVAGTYRKNNYQITEKKEVCIRYENDFAMMKRTFDFRKYKHSQKF